MQIGKTDTVIQAELNTRAGPVERDAHMGDVLYDTLNAVNSLLTQFKALLAHLDTANVTGIGNANAATYAPVTSAVALPGAR